MDANEVIARITSGWIQDPPNAATSSGWIAALVIFLSATVLAQGVTAWLSPRRPAWVEAFYDVVDIVWVASSVAAFCIVAYALSVNSIQTGADIWKFKLKWQGHASAMATELQAARCPERRHQRALEHVQFCEDMATIVRHAARLAEDTKGIGHDVALAPYPADIVERVRPASFSSGWHGLQAELRDINRSVAAYEVNRAQLGRVRMAGWWRFAWTVIFPIAAALRLNKSIRHLVTTIAKARGQHSQRAPTSTEVAPDAA